jgi:hypothetical protein
LQAVDGHVLIYVHKERELNDVETRYPADHYVLIDDKLTILTPVKSSWGTRVTTVFPRQGRYANDPQIVASHPAPDLTVDRIGDLLDCDLPTLLATDAGRHPTSQKVLPFRGRPEKAVSASMPSPGQEP